MSLFENVRRNTATITRRIKQRQLEKEHASVSITPEEEQFLTDIVNGCTSVESRTMILTESALDVDPPRTRVELWTGDLSAFYRLKETHFDRLVVTYLTSTITKLLNTKPTDQFWVTYDDSATGDTGTDGEEVSLIVHW